MRGFGASGAAAATRIARNGANSFQPYVPSRLRLARQFGDALEREDLARDGGEHSCLIARSGPDFERAVVPGHFQQFGLASDDVRL